MNIKEVDSCIEMNRDLLKGGKATPADIASYTLGNQIVILTALKDIQKDLDILKNNSHSGETLA